MWFEKSIEIFEEVDSWHSVAVLLSNIAILYLDTGNKAKARQYLKESYKIYLKLNLKSDAEKVSQLLEEL
jgi:hypothetical protein